MQYSLPIFNADRPFAVLTTWQGQGQLPGVLLGAPNTMPGVLRSEQPIARGELLGEPGKAAWRTAWRACHVSLQSRRERCLAGKEKSPGGLLGAPGIAPRKELRAKDGEATTVPGIKPPILFIPCIADW